MFKGPSPACMVSGQGHYRRGVCGVGGQGLPPKLLILFIYISLQLTMCKLLTQYFMAREARHFAPFCLSVFLSVGTLHKPYGLYLLLIIHDTVAHQILALFWHACKDLIMVLCRFGNRPDNNTVCMVQCLCPIRRGLRGGWRYADKSDTRRTIVIYSNGFILKICINCSTTTGKTLYKSFFLRRKIILLLF